MLKDHQDAYGYEIYDYYLGDKDIVEIVEREDGFIEVSAGPSFYFKTFENWPEPEQKAISFVRGRVMDVGCGAGRISLYLQEKGHDVLGIDISPKAIEVCQLGGLKNTEVISITQVSAKLGEFDTIMMMGNNFGLFANPRRAKWLLRKFHKITSVNGRIIATSNDIYATEEPEHLAYHQFNRDRGRWSGQVRIRIRHKKMKTPWFDYLMVSRDEMKLLLEDTGWEVSQFIDSKTSNYIAIIDKAM